MPAGTTLLLTVGTSLTFKKDLADGLLRTATPRPEVRNEGRPETGPDANAPAGHSPVRPAAAPPPGAGKTLLSWPTRQSKEQVEADLKNWRIDRRRPSGSFAGSLEALAGLSLECIDRARGVTSGSPPGGAELPDPFPAEISTLYLTSKDALRWRQPVRLGLLATDTPLGLWCAYAVRYLLDAFVANGTWPCPFEFLDDGRAEAPRNAFGSGVCQVLGLQPGDPEDFGSRGLVSLAQTVLRFAESVEPPDQVILDVTGGFKSVLPFAGALGAILPSVVVQSLFEFSPAHVHQPALPITIDAAGWARNRVILDMLTSSLDSSRRACEIEEFWKTLPPEFKSLYRRPRDPDRQPLQRTHLLDHVSRKANELTRLGAIPAHQPPEFVRSLFARPEIAKELLDWVERAGQIWYGDLIPETVEHGRGHAHRLWEQAFRIVQPIREVDPAAITDEEVFLLLATLWVHDVGHTAYQLDIALPSPGQVLAEPEARLTRADISAFPSLVRDLHSFTGWQLLREQPGMFHFPAARPVLGVPMHEAVALCYRFHRNKLTLGGRSRADFFSKEKNGVDPSCGVGASWRWVPEVEVGVARMQPGLTDPASFLFVTALQRLIDASDVQAERAGDPDFRSRRGALTHGEIQTEWDRLQRLRGALLTEPDPLFRPWVDPGVENGAYRRLVTSYLELTDVRGDCGIPVREHGSERFIQPPARARVDAHLKLLESQIYLELQRLWSLEHLDTASALFLEYLSAFDRILFKYPQVIHYEEVHGPVLRTTFLKAASFTRHRHAFEAEMRVVSGSDERRARELAQGVWDEYNPEVREILAARGFFFEGLRVKEDQDLGFEFRVP